MLEINVKEARSRLSKLLDRVEKGEEIIIKRRGKRIAKLVSPERESHLPSLEDFRRAIKVAGKPLSRVVSDARDDERF
jgi:prevent-host-death family protein